MDTPDSSQTTGTIPTPKSGPLHSILIRHGASFDHDDDSFFHTPMRPRANTDPMSPRPNLHVRFNLPDIIVDDCSDNDDDQVDKAHPEEINKELANTNEGAFFVFKSPPRQRSNTCPVNMFSKRKKALDRPPTPPPADKLPQDTFPRYPSWEKVHFSPHSLDSVEEGKEQTAGDKKGVVTSKIDCRSRKISLTKTVKTTKVKTSGTRDGVSTSPKRGCTNVTNGHVPQKSNGIRDAIQSSA
ncbi:hypothetical protein ACF0H5_009261 [Mactra antiquata]